MLRQYLEDSSFTHKTAFYLRPSPQCHLYSSISLHCLLAYYIISQKLFTYLFEAAMTLLPSLGLHCRLIDELLFPF